MCDRKCDGGEWGEGEMQRPGEAQMRCVSVKITEQLARRSATKACIYRFQLEGD